MPLTVTASSWCAIEHDHQADAADKILMRDIGPDGVAHQAKAGAGARPGTVPRIRHRRVSPHGWCARPRGRRRRRPAISREQGRASLRLASLRALLRGHMREDCDVIRRLKLPRFSPISGLDASAGPSRCATERRHQGTAAADAHDRPLIHRLANAVEARLRRLCEVEVVTPRGCWGLTSWTCTRRAGPATTGGRAEDVRPKRHKAAIDGRERQRRNEGGKPQAGGQPRGARRGRSRGDPRLSTVLSALPGPAGVAR